MSNKEGKKKTGGGSKKLTKEVGVKQTENVKDNLVAQEDILSDKTKSILKARAVKLSTILEKEKHDDELFVIEFILGKEVYAFENEYVREVITLTKYTAIPGLPSFILGVVNVRGEIISVINLKKLINLPEKGIGELNKIVILENENMEFGVLADSIIGMRNIKSGSVQESMSGISDMLKEFLYGVTKEDNTIILNADKMLNSDKLLINQEY